MPKGIESMRERFAHIRNNIEAKVDTLKRINLQSEKPNVNNAASLDEQLSTAITDSKNRARLLLEDLHSAHAIRDVPRSKTRSSSRPLIIEGDWTAITHEELENGHS